MLAVFFMLNFSFRRISNILPWHRNYDMIQTMKRFTATILLLGYALLVPFCFFGGMLAASAHTMNMTGGAHAMPVVPDCGMQTPGCVGDTGPIAHHMSMFNSITQTPLTDLSLSLVVLALSLAVIFSLNYRLLAQLFARHSYHPPQRSHESKGAIKQNLLTWLSLLETSPTFA